TSGRASVGMKPCTKALYVSLISRCDSAAIVSNTSELLPEPETPVNTVSRRFGISTLTSLRLFSRAPCTRMTSWLSAPCGAGGRVRHDRRAGVAGRADRDPAPPGVSDIVADLEAEPVAIEGQRRVRIGVREEGGVNRDVHVGHVSCGSMTRALRFLTGLVAC